MHGRGSRSTRVNRYPTPGQRLASSRVEVPALDGAYAHIRRSQFQSLVPEVRARAHVPRSAPPDTVVAFRDACQARSVQVVRNVRRALPKVLPVDQQRTTHGMDDDVAQSHVAVPPTLFVQRYQEFPQRVPILDRHVVRKVQQRNQPLHLEPARIEAVQLGCGPWDVLVGEHFALPALVLLLAVVLQHRQVPEVERCPTHRLAPLFTSVPCVRPKGTFSAARMKGSSSHSKRPLRLSGVLLYSV